jgi:CheY-like chemotaxis protein
MKTYKASALTLVSSSPAPSNFGMPIDILFDSQRPQALTELTTSEQPNVLVITQDAKKYEGLLGKVDFVSNETRAQMYLSNAASRGIVYDLVLADLQLNGSSGYHATRMLRKICRYEGDLYVLMDRPLLCDDHHAKRAGATGAMRRDLPTLNMLINREAPQTYQAPVPPPSYVTIVIDAMREFLASEAHSQIMGLYEEINSPMSR